jgi:prepilin-type N-terminal cleavage/methylation domain-containing protein
VIARRPLRIAPSAGQTSCGDGIDTGDPRQRGYALIEVLIASIVVGIGVLGVSLMLTHGSAFTASQGVSQVELYLAEQKLERLRVMGYVGTAVLASSDVGATAGCGTDAEPCYNETLQGSGAVRSGQGQSFTRLTCVDYVADSGPPYPTACPGTLPAQPPCWSSAANLSCTKRVRVTVQPLNQAAVARPDPITLEMILVNPPQATP